MTMDEMLVEHCEHVMKSGFSMVHIIPTDNTPSYTYTIGLGVNPRYQGCDFVIVALPPLVAAQTLTNLYQEYISVGIKVSDGQVLHELANVPVIVRQIYKDVNIFGLGTRVSNLLRQMVDLEPQDNYPMMQLCWPDEAGKYCWEAGYDTGELRQSLITEDWTLNRIHN